MTLPDELKNLSPDALAELELLLEAAQCDLRRSLTRVGDVRAAVEEARRSHAERRKKEESNR